jgi:hypothetical protein
MWAESAHIEKSTGKVVSTSPVERVHHVVDSRACTCPVSASGAELSEILQQETGQKMIRIERGREIGPGIYEYRVWGRPISGESRQPLLDACRQLKAIGGFTG